MCYLSSARFERSRRIRNMTKIFTYILQKKENHATWSAFTKTFLCGSRSDWKERWENICQYNRGWSILHVKMNRLRRKQWLNTRCACLCLPPSITTWSTDFEPERSAANRQGPRISMIPKWYMYRKYEARIFFTSSFRHSRCHNPDAQVLSCSETKFTSESWDHRCIRQYRKKPSQHCSSHDCLYHRTLVIATEKSMCMQYTGLSGSRS